MTAAQPRREVPHDDIERRSTRQSPGDRRANRRTVASGRAQGVKLEIYEHLLAINAGFDQVIRGLAALRKHDSFLGREFDRCSELTKETRAATNSYLVGVLEQGETSEAGRRFRKRRVRERQEESA